MLSEARLLYALIIGCEVAFWAVMLLSLFARYHWRRPALSRWLLLSLPVIDLVLVALTALDLRAGTVATAAHGLAAVYVGFTVAFGPVTVRWADAQFAHRFAGGPRPPTTPTGKAAVRWDFDLWLRCVAAWVIAWVLIEALVAFVGDPAVTKPLAAWHRYGVGTIFFWFLFGPLWSVVAALKQAR